MSYPKIVRQTPVKHGDEWALTVSTVQIARNYYDTVVFDDSADKRHAGMKLGGFVIDHGNVRSNTREEAMGQHREALDAARTETPCPPGGLRYTVRELGPLSFAVHDNVSQLDYDPCFTRRAAQNEADRRNAEDPS